MSHLMLPEVSGNNLQIIRIDSIEYVSSEEMYVSDLGKTICSVITLTNGNRHYSSKTVAEIYQTICTAQGL